MDFDEMLYCFKHKSLYREFIFGSYPYNELGVNFAVNILNTESYSQK
jgi:hypothetical protein